MNKPTLCRTGKIGLTFKNFPKELIDYWLVKDGNGKIIFKSKDYETALQAWDRERQAEQAEQLELLI